MDKQMLNTIRYCNADDLPPFALMPPSAASSRRIREKVRRKLTKSTALAYPKMFAAVAVLILCIATAPLTLKIGGELGEAFILAGGDVVSELLSHLPEEDVLFPDGSGSLRYMGFRREDTATYLQFRVETEPMENGALRCQNLTLRDARGEMLTEMEQFIINMTASTMLTSGAEGWSVGAVSGDAYVFELEAEPTLDEDAYLYLRMEDVLHYSASSALEAFAGLLSLGFQVREYAAEPIETAPTEWGGYVQPLSLAGISSDGRNLTLNFFVESPDVRGVAAFCRNLTLSHANGAPIVGYEWDMDDTAYMANALMAGDVLPAGISHEDGRILLQLTVPVQEITPGEALILTIDELVTADMPEKELILYPAADSLELAFTADGIDAPETVPVRVTSDDRMTVTDVKRLSDGTLITARVETEALPGAFIVCDEVRVESASGEVLYLHNYGSGRTSRVETQAAAMVLAGDVLTVGTVGADAFEFQVKLPAKKTQDIAHLTLTLVNPTAVDTFDGIHATVHPLADSLACTFTLG